MACDKIGGDREALEDFDQAMGMAPRPVKEDEREVRRREVREDVADLAAYGDAEVEARTDR